MCFIKLLFVLSISGGYDSNEQLTKYRIDRNEFSYNDEKYLSEKLHNEYGEYGCVFYSQINSTTLFTIRQSGDYIHVYDLRTVDSGTGFTVISESIPITVGDAACLASHELPIPRLYVIGGDPDKDYKNPMANFQILDLYEYFWSSGTDMNFARYSHGCIVVNNTLWVMGTVQQIETIDINNVHDANWSVHNDLMIEEDLIDFGVVAVDHLIYIVGGWIGDYGSGESSRVIHVIDTISGCMNNETLSIPMSGLTMVTADGNIYGFGGYSGSGAWKLEDAINSWVQLEQFSDLFVCLRAFRIQNMNDINHRKLPLKNVCSIRHSERWNHSSR